MTAPLLSIGPRVRKSPYYEATRRWGATAFSTYNHMYIPTQYESVEDDYWNLVERVSVWDVAVERQLEVRGADAGRFSQYLTCRNLSTMEVGACRYVPLVDENGGMVNDPVLLKMDDDCFWFSLADSDALLWAKGLAAAGGWDVQLNEPDVSPMQVQGPRSKDLMRGLVGGIIDRLPYFCWFHLYFHGVRLVISRTGWSGELGYEIYLTEHEFGDELWEQVMRAGREFGVAPGCPNAIRRIEAGILSYQADMTLNETPYDIGLSRMVSFADGVEYLGREALEAASNTSPRRELVGLEIDGKQLPLNEGPWQVTANNQPAGKVTSAAHSPRLEKNIALALLDTEREGDLEVRCLNEGLDELRRAKVTSVPFVDPTKSLARG